MLLVVTPAAKVTINSLINLRIRRIRFPALGSNGRAHSRSTRMPPPAGRISSTPEGKCDHFPIP